MSKAIASGFAAFVVLASSVAAAEPLVLSDRQLDAVAAGATSGAEVFAETPGMPRQTNSATGTSGQITPLAALAFSNDGLNLAGIEGGFTTYETPNASVSIGFFRGQVENSGGVGATGTASGDTSVADGIAIDVPAVISPGTTIYITYGIGIDMPMSNG